MIVRGRTLTATIRRATRPTADIESAPERIELFLEAARDVGTIVAAEALLDARHAGESYTLSGPHALTLQQVTERIGAASGEPVR